MIVKIVSGGQTGVDQAAWRAAKKLGIETGGWMPRGFLAEDGEHPEFAGLYGARETDSPNYPDRTEANVREAEVTLWLGPAAGSTGFRCTERAASKWDKLLVIVPTFGSNPEITARCLEGFSVINVAGNRESRNPGVGARAEGWLSMMLALTQLV